MNLGGFPLTESGDCLRLVVAFTDEDYGLRLEASHALARAIGGAASTSDEPAVCAAQLEWWREELDRLEAGNARHPAAQAFAEHVAVDGDAPRYMAEWIVDAERRLFGPPAEDEASHRAAAFRRYGSMVVLAIEPGVRAAAIPVVRDAAAALYALDAVKDDRVFEYPAAMQLYDTLLGHVQVVPDVGTAVLAATAGNAMRRRYDGLRPGSFRQLRFAWRSARRGARNAKAIGADL